MKRGGPLRRLTPLRSYTELARGGRLNPRSKKRRGEEAEYKIRRDAYMSGHKFCELCEEAPSAELHHRRGRVGKDLIDTDHFAALCSNCHRWATENPAAAYRVGISEPRIGRGAA